MHFQMQLLRTCTALRFIRLIVGFIFFVCVEKITFFFKLRKYFYDAVLRVKCEILCSCLTWESLNFLRNTPSNCVIVYVHNSVWFQLIIMNETQSYLCCANFHYSIHSHILQINYILWHLLNFKTSPIMSHRKNCRAKLSFIAQLFCS